MSNNDELARPFRALRPRAETAVSVIAPPYDVLSFAEAVALAEGRPHSFLHISRPEIDCAPGTDPHSDEVYSRGAANLERLVESGVLERDTAPSFYVYRMTSGTHTQTGVALAGSIAAYESNRIRKHERTRPDKETDRVRNITALNAQTGPVLCAYRSNTGIGALLARAAEAEPLFAVEGPNDVTHSVWQVAEPADVAALAEALNGLDALYIADGHHRSAAAARVAEARRRNGDTDGAQSFLCVAFPHDELDILDYNRVVGDLADLSVDTFLARVSAYFAVEKADRAVRPERHGEVTMYLDRHWYRLRIDPERIPSDPVAALDVSLLQGHLLEPILRIEDPRSDPRIDFVGGIRGLEALEGRVDAGDAAVAFALYPTSMEQLMAVADAEALMPPKSTWFEPKLADGLLSHVLD